MIRLSHTPPVRGRRNTYLSQGSSELTLNELVLGPEEPQLQPASAQAAEPPDFCPPTPGRNQLGCVDVPTHSNSHLSCGHTKKVLPYIATPKHSETRCGMVQYPRALLWTSVAGNCSPENKQMPQQRLTHLVHVHPTAISLAHSLPHTTWG